MSSKQPVAGPDRRRPRSGRRPGDSGTRAAILAAAREQFADQGYDRTSVRSIAAQAGVDPALVSHFHSSKQALFAAVVELPFDPAEVLPRLLAGGHEHVGQRLAEFVVGVMESPEGRRRILGLVRAATSEPEAARLVRELITAEMLGPLAAALPVDDAPYRAALAGSQVVGLAMARHVIAVEPLASQPPDVVAASLGPTLQRYLTGPLQ